tara:strand:+ start:11165 stop:12979 length:1815 start_codon:yes stop_codon:yes gene_type:complete
MQLESIDWIIIISFFIISLIIGIWTSRTAGKSINSFFLSGRSMPWWLLGISMVATTFSADTPNLVTDIVRKNGVAGNWVWWAFLLTGMLTVFVYAKLWRRSEVLTDLEFYEIRYGGKGAAMLRGFRAIYLGVFFNIMIMATVCLAAIKIGSVLLDFSPAQTLVSAAVVTVLYSALGGLRGVIITDFFQFILAMTATIWSAVVIVNLPQVGGLSKLISNPIVIPKLPVIPAITNFNFNDPQTDLLITILILPLAVQWWSVWYPGAEPGGGGYIAQRMLSAKDEKNAIWATLLFNFMHYAVRPWPWILVALCSLIVFPDLESLSLAFPNVSPDLIGDDLAYPAMMSYLPSGLLGLLIASLMAAFMSTLSTHLNWGSSYIVHDFYHRFINPNASEKSLVFLARVSTLILMIMAALVALTLQNALQAFQILLQIGAGTGLLFILRWFWYRINVYSEFTAMIVSFILAVYLQLIHTALGFEIISSSIQLLIGVGLTTLSWVLVTIFTKPESDEVLMDFYKKVHPGGPGWKYILDVAESKGEKITDKKEKWDVPNGLLCMLFGTLSVYSVLFSVGSLIYGNNSSFLLTSIIGIVSLFALFYFWKKGSAEY